MLTVHFSGPQTTPWYRLGGFSVIFLFTESCLFAYPRRYTVASRPLSTSLLVVHVFRLSIVAFLVGITVGSQLIPSRCRNGDEESLPLLGDDSSRNNNNRWGGYSTIHDVTTPRAESPNHHCVKPSDELIGLVKVRQPIASTISKTYCAAVLPPFLLASAQAASAASLYRNRSLPID